MDIDTQKTRILRSSLSVSYALTSELVFRSLLIFASLFTLFPGPERLDCEGEPCEVFFATDSDAVTNTTNTIHLFNSFRSPHSSAISRTIPSWGALSPLPLTRPRSSPLRTSRPIVARATNLCPASMSERGSITTTAPTAALPSMAPAVRTMPSRGLTPPGPSRRCWWRRWIGASLRRRRWGCWRTG